MGNLECLWWYSRLLELVNHLSQLKQVWYNMAMVAKKIGGISMTCNLLYKSLQGRVSKNFLKLMKSHKIIIYYSI